MIPVVEVIIHKFKSGQTPSEGEVVFAEVLTIKEYNKRKDSLSKMYDSIQKEDSNLLTYSDGDYIRIYSEPRDASFNYRKDLIYTKAVTKDKCFHKKAVKRLCRYLSKRSLEFNYYGGLDSIKHGENMYTFGTRNFSILEDSDRELKIKRLTTGRRAAITRSINKAKKIKTKYFNTLFPCFKSLVSNLYKQKSRFNEAKMMCIDDIESAIGGCNKKSQDSLNKLREVLNIGNESSI